MKTQTYSTSARYALIVEDDTELREQIADVLTKMRIKHVTARSASEAETKLRNQSFSLVILDLRLEKGSAGEEVIEFMRRDEHSPHLKTPILVISGFLEQPILERIARQVSAVMVKPFPPEEFRRRVETALASPAQRMKS